METFSVTGFIEAAMAGSCTGIHLLLFAGGTLRDCFSDPSLTGLGEEAGTHDACAIAEVVGILQTNV